MFENIFRTIDLFAGPHLQFHEFFSHVFGVSLNFVTQKLVVPNASASESDCDSEGGGQGVLNLKPTRFVNKQLMHAQFMTGIGFGLIV